MEAGASVNFYMFFGGTNFGFTAGANYDGPGKYKADITSYDYDAPMDETGDVTPKYQILRDVIKDFLPLPNITIPLKTPKMKIPTIEVHPKTALLSSVGRQFLGSKVIQSEKPLTFEEINQFSGFVLYETELPTFKMDPSVLTIPTLHDRAVVTIDNVNLHNRFSTLICGIRKLLYKFKFFFYDCRNSLVYYLAKTWQIHCQLVLVLAKCCKF